MPHARSFYNELKNWDFSLSLFSWLLKNSHFKYKLLHAPLSLWSISRKKKKSVISSRVTSEIKKKKFLTWPCILLSIWLQGSVCTRFSCPRIFVYNHHHHQFFFFVFFSPSFREETCDGAAATPPKRCLHTLRDLTIGIGIHFQHVFFVFLSFFLTFRDDYTTAQLKAKQ